MALILLKEEISIAQRAILLLFLDENHNVIFSRKSFDIKRKIEQGEYDSLYLYGVSSGFNELNLKNNSILDSKELKNIMLKNSDNYLLQYIIAIKGDSVVAHLLTSKQKEIIFLQF